MKSVVLVLLAACCLVSASDRIIAPVNITLTMQVQNSSVTNGTVRTDLNPTTFRLTSKDILARVASQAYLAGKYGFTSYPKGSYLAYVYFPHSSSGTNHFAVVNAGIEIADLSRVFVVYPDEQISQGNYDLATALSRNFKVSSLKTLYYDETTVNGDGLSIHASGLATDTSNDKALAGGLQFSGSRAHKWVLQGAGYLLQSFDYYGTMQTVLVSGSLSNSGSGAIDYTSK